MPSAEVRPARPADVARVAEIHVASWRAAYKGIVPDEALADRTVSKRIDNWRGWLENPEFADHRLFVVEEVGSIQGFAFAGPNSDEDVDPAETVDVNALYIDPPAQGSGRGRLLLDHVLAYFSDRGFCLATLYVLIGNERAARFYDRLGWTAEPDVVKECLGDGTEAPQIRYRKVLAPPG